MRRDNPSGRPGGQGGDRPRLLRRRPWRAPTRAREGPGAPLHGSGASHARARAGGGGGGVERSFRASRYGYGRLWSTPARAREGASAPLCGVAAHCRAGTPGRWGAGPPDAPARSRARRHPAPAGALARWHTAMAGRWRAGAPGTTPPGPAVAAGRLAPARGAPAPRPGGHSARKQRPAAGFGATFRAPTAPPRARR